EHGRRVGREEDGRPAGDGGSGGEQKSAPRALEDERPAAPERPADGGGLLRLAGRQDEIVPCEQAEAGVGGAPEFLQADAEVLRGEGGG
ncbi:MAG: hypothetical protein DRH15_12680, partial [Deltaproteobacteria bacterium]